MTSWVYWPLQAAYEYLYPPPPQQVVEPIRPWCEGLHIITSRELTEGKQEYTEILPLFPELEAINTREVADDGNCLFSALALFLAKDPAEVREEIVAYLKEHKEDEFVSESIPLCIEDHNTGCDTQLDTQTASIGAMFEGGHIDEAEFSSQLERLASEIEATKIATPDRYLERIAEDRFFGGPIEVYAAAHLYQISIGLYEARSEKYAPSFICAPLEAEGRRKCSLHYIRCKQHYDLMIEGGD